MPSRQGCNSTEPLEIGLKTWPWLDMVSIRYHALHKIFFRKKVSILPSSVLLSASLCCYVLYTGCHRLPTPFQHLVFPLWRQLPGSAETNRPDKQNNPSKPLKKQIEQMGNCFLTQCKSGGFLSFSFLAPRKQDLSRIFVKNKVSLPCAEKLLIRWLRHLPRAVEQPKRVLTFLNSEQRAEMPFPCNHRLWAIPSKIVPVLYPFIPFSPLQIPIWVWATFSVQNSTFFCRTYRFQKFSFPTATVSAELVSLAIEVLQPFLFPMAAAKHWNMLLEKLLEMPLTLVTTTNTAHWEVLTWTYTAQFNQILVLSFNSKKKSFLLFSFSFAFNNSQNTKTPHMKI